MARVLLTDISLGASTSRRGGIILRVHSCTGIMRAGFELSKSQTRNIIVDLVEALAGVDRDLAADTLKQAIDAATRINESADNSPHSQNKGNSYEH